MNKQELLALRRKTHGLNPVVIIGANALTDAVHAEIETALNAHELIKIRVNAGDKEERRAMTNEICHTHQAILIKSIGHVIAIYRKSEN